MFKMVDVMWYVTDNDIIPFVTNLNKTKVKLLSNNKIVSIEEGFGNCSDDSDRKVLVERFSKALLVATGRVGRIVADRVSFLKKYLFSTSNENSIFIWLAEIKTQNEILELCNKMIQNYHDEIDEKLKNSRNF